MRILVIGNNGFLGKQITEFLAMSNECYGIDIQKKSSQEHYFCVDKLSPEYISIFKTMQFDVCINTSGSANVGNSLKFPLYDAKLNTFNVYNILQAIKETQIGCRFIQFSSAAVYGNPVELPVKEEDKLTPISPYGYNKMHAEKICEMYHSIYNIDICVVRPFSIYGIGQEKMLLWDLVYKFINDDIVFLNGTGDETRDYINIKDFIQSIDILVHKTNCSCKYKTYNIANGKQIKVKTMAELVKRSMKINKSIVFTNKNRKGDPLYWEADISKIKKLGYKQKISIEEGVYEYTNWAEKKIESL